MEMPRFNTAKKLVKFAIFHINPEKVPGRIIRLSIPGLFTKYIANPPINMPDDIGNKNSKGCSLDNLRGTK